MKIMVYHVGFEIIRGPDINRGRKNADFGQGFYLSDDLEFSRRWSRVRKDEDTVLNAYELDLNGLQVRRLNRNEEWFEYIFENRNHVVLFRLTWLMKLFRL